MKVLVLGDVVLRLGLISGDPGSVRLSSFMGRENIHMYEKVPDQRPETILTPLSDAFLHLWIMVFQEKFWEGQVVLRPGSRTRNGARQAEVGSSAPLKASQPPRASYRNS